MSKVNTNNSGTHQVVISKQKRFIFNLVLLAIPVLFFLMFEGTLRLLNYGKDLSLFFKSENYLGYYEINRHVTLRYFTKGNETSPTSDIFLVEKPDTCYRIFVLGESTARGFPYQAGTSFPRILYYRLQDAFPHQRIEVINLSASAINSYSYSDMVDEVLEHQPDLILVYGGHNEYYGALGAGSVEKGGNFRWMKKVRLKMNHLRTYQLLQNGIIKFGAKLTPKKERVAETLMSRIVKDKDIVYESKLYQKGVEQFRLNMNELVSKANKNNVPVVLSELVNNVNDQPPFASIATKNQPAAIDVFNEAVKEEQSGNIAKAKDLYYRAKDLDVIRFRAPEAMNEILHQISTTYQLPIVPMKTYFEAASPNGLIGHELLLEHLHPNIDGYFLMADAFFNTLIEYKLLKQEPVKIPLKTSAEYRQNWSFTELDSLIGDLNIRSLKAGWPFKPENETNLFLSTYQPVGTVDSMAFAYITKSSIDRHIEDEHIKLAQYYFSAGLFDKAFKEYLSIIKLHPYIADLYFDATKYLIAQKKYSQALELILSAPHMPHDHFYYYMTGTLKLKLERWKEGIDELEKAYSMMPADFKPTRILIPLYTAYHETGDTQNTQRILALIRNHMPHFSMDEPDEKGKTIVRKIAFDEIYDRAMVLIQKGEVGEAMKLLVATNQVKETAPAHKMIGMIYLMQKNNDLAYEYCMKSYQLDPSDYDNLNNLFILSLMKKNMVLAAEVLNHIRFLNIDTEKLKRLEVLYDKRLKELENSDGFNS